MRVKQAHAHSPARRLGVTLLASFALTIISFSMAT